MPVDRPAYNRGRRPSAPPHPRRTAIDHPAPIRPVTWRTTLGRLVHISRPVLWINTIGTGVLGMWLTGALLDPAAIPLLVWLTLPFNLLIYGVNDIFDQETDALNPRKGSIEGARIEPREVRTIVWAVAITNVPFLV